MQKEQGFIEAIKADDATSLEQFLGSTDDLESVLREPLTSPRPTDHAIGFGMTLLQFASFRRWGDRNTASVLIERGAEVDFHSACGLGMIDRVVELLDTDPKLINQQVDSYFPIQFAIMASQPAVIECLCDHGDDPNRDLRKVAYFAWEDDARDNNRTPWKPVQMASLWSFDASRMTVIDALMSAAADPDAVSPLGGYRPIHLAAMADRTDAIRFLVSHGVDVDSRTEQSVSIEIDCDRAGPIAGLGCTPLMVAAAEGFPDTTSVLLQLGADPTVANASGMAAIDFAEQAYWDHRPYDLVMQLLESA